MKSNMFGISKEGFKRVSQAVKSVEEPKYKITYSDHEYLGESGWNQDDIDASLFTHSDIKNILEEEFKENPDGAYGIYVFDEEDNRVSLENFNFTDPPKSKALDELAEQDSYGLYRPF